MITDGLNPFTVLLFLGFFVLGVALTGQLSFQLAGPATGTGEAWVPGWADTLVYLMGASIVLAIQYGRIRMSSSSVRIPTLEN